MAQTEVTQRKLFYTSSLNKYFLCDNCGSENRFIDKKSLRDHIKCCNRKINLNQVTVKPRKLRSIDTKIHFCPVCSKNYVNFSTLRYHIRQAHFNLISKTPYYEQKKINQVWFENVLNSDAVIEVHKTGVNSLVIRRLSKNTAIKVHKTETSKVDLTNMYPTYNRKKLVQCTECGINVHPHLLIKHKLKHQREKEGANQV
ncbi:uncharacterized protein LOC106133696 [Amyelois transitella]|uniref:uncharacterized protein LOC106133696 n=1 Tax=Amyelois transitella TaxID=680683 RepID=UPI00067C41A0|nr:uncharacterized protein LOC106133696 [Amyelois transitella]